MVRTPITLSNKSYLFIANPQAGKSPNRVMDVIKENMPGGSSLVTTQKAGDAYLFAWRGAKEGKICVAVGGDGTVNEVARGVMKENGIMGVIPAGSGNGVSRHFHIPQKPEKALKRLLEGREKTVDTAKAGEHFFMMLAGLGFDAHVAEKMAQRKKRGLYAYVKIVAQLWLKRKPVKVKIEHDEGIENVTAFSIIAANTSQFGNNVYIAPGADATDGYLDLVIVKSFLSSALIRVVLEVMGVVKRPKYVRRLKTKKALLTSYETKMNIDGEHVTVQSPVIVECVPSSLRLIIA